jgi:hypothetical protein
MTPRDLLKELCERGLWLRVEGDRIGFAPKELVTPELLDALRELKREVLDLLRWETCFLEAPLSVFGQSELRVELHVAGLAETIWFASNQSQVELLLQEGVARGRIWQAEEIRILWAWDGDHQQVLQVIKSKLAFNSILTQVGTRPAACHARPRASDPAEANLDLGIGRPSEVD